jgi:hypothetical protein
MKMEQTESSETPAHKIQTPGNHPKERIQHLKKYIDARHICEITLEVTDDIHISKGFRT